ncbi:sensor histidine kinase [Desulfurispirillum indicum]|uniref:sensor histidine kinase n=1 Tax=Desulfurispirillum indicum TaxID=936456 RepID=UPI001CFB8597|nr:sensor histidine kinase [Desulfurispirillum indicum]UCZ57682.1 sensor histidine kinase [Desulfurispirillum indicum]
MRSAGTAFARTLLLLILVLAHTPAFAASQLPFDVTHLHNTHSLVERMEFLYDPLAEHNYRDIMASDAWQALPASYLGYSSRPVWTRVTISNSAPRNRAVILWNTRPLVQHVDVYIVDEDTLLEHHRLGYMNQAEPSNTSPFNSFLLKLTPDQTVTIYTRTQTAAEVDVEWLVSTVTDFSREAIKRYLFWGVYLGLLFAFILYSAISSFDLRQPKFLAHFSFCVVSLFFVLAYSGITRFADYGIPNTYWFYSMWVLGYGGYIAVTLFVMYFFRTSSTMPGMHMWLQVLLMATSLLVLLWLAAPSLPSIYALTPQMASFNLVLYLTFFAVAWHAVKRRQSGALIFLSGQGLVLLLSAVLFFVGESGLIEHLNYVTLAIPLNIFLHITSISLAIGKDGRDGRYELESQKQSMLNQSRFAVIGRSLGMIAHQWRTPLARLGALLSELQTYLEPARTADDHTQRIREVIIPRMRESVAFMGSTVDDFRNFYSSGSTREEFFPDRTIKQVLLMLKEIPLFQRTSVHCHGPEALPMLGYPGAFAHVLMILLENALDTFSERNTADPSLHISWQQRENTLILQVEDNGGGICIHPVEKIFSSFISSKVHKGMGMGLSIARMLVEERMGGTIQAGNTGRGALFTVTLPLRGSAPLNDSKHVE